MSKPKNKKAEAPEVENPQVETPEVQQPAPKPEPEPADFILDYYTIEDYDANKPFAEQDFAEFKMRSQTEETDTNL